MIRTVKLFISQTVATILCMNILAVILAACIIVTLLTWSTAFLILNDFSVPTKNIDTYKNILVIFPHADDEALTASGIMRNASLSGKNVIWAILTKGERGNPEAIVDENLKQTRVQEVQAVAKLLGVKRFIQEDFGDGQIAHRRADITKFLAGLFQKEQPDLVITYDTSGWYGHPDHIATAEIVTKLVKDQCMTTRLWYVTLPMRVWTLSGGMPTHMAQIPDWAEHRTYPTCKVYIGRNVIKTIRSVYLYRSQHRSFRESIPFAPIPMWFFISMGWFEYFHQAQIEPYDGE
jgi:LmbE family N-acetylglucosaminyl deacetylase